MEPVVKIDQEKCTACYACVRSCPVKAIKVEPDRPAPMIIPDRCIGCGNCHAACGEDAIIIRDGKTDLRKLLKQGEEVTALLDPSIAGEFPDITDYRKFVSMVRKLGFRFVNEVAFGVELVAAEYRKLVDDSKGKYYLFSNCPISVMYVEKYKPELTRNLAPIMPPVVATARVVRQKYGNDMRVAYISPLIASKQEAVRLAEDEKIDAVLTFIELRELFSEYKIDEKNLEYSEFDNPIGYLGSLFPLSSGILEAAGIEQRVLSSKVITVEGDLVFDSIREFEEDITTIKSHFNIFYKEFIMGRGTSPNARKWLRRSQLIRYLNKREKTFDQEAHDKALLEYSGIGLTRSFRNDDQRMEAPPAEEVEKIQAELRKHGDQERGCGACGYRSCHEFAVAIAQGLAVPEMCNFYASRNTMDHIQSLKISNEKLAQAQVALKESEQIAQKEKESAREASEITRTMLQKLPSAVVILDETLKVIQANESLIGLLGEEAMEINEVVPGLTGADLKTLLPYNIHNLFTYVLANNENITDRDILLNEKQYSISVFVIRKQKIVGAVIRDLSAPEVQKEEIVKRLTDVVDKNLSLVQQIGFILGEGASETERMLNSIIESYKPKK
ncbi:MAG: [Fe-Fe] hydrogenase large subunit C-terminal domain-containing protein [Bacteroidales bacterium]|nr:[Fe-Fe] hydrogenase large subunit C-terminal domain-containing protein [Bacteroidales bacterium]MDT8431064.1 [Fe-Fe] hydrogenase large subunit C-terminal domain-containing protein [Bacteroidales bacterium]